MIQRAARRIDIVSGPFAWIEATLLRELGDEVEVELEVFGRKARVVLPRVEVSLDGDDARVEIADAGSSQS